MVLVNTEEDEHLFDSLKDIIVKIQRPIEEDIRGNDTLRAPTVMPNDYHGLMCRISEVGFIRVLDIHEKNYYKNRIRKACSQ